MPMSANNSPARVLISDFDGTLTQRDFYQVFRDRYLKGDASDFWAAYRAGQMTHFEALRKIFEAAAPGEQALWSLTSLMNLEPELAGCVSRLRSQGWKIVIVSAGCRWYIDRLLAQAGVSLPVHANLGSIVEGRLVMERPVDSPFFSHENGIDKPAVVRHYLDAGNEVAFAGDGYPDLEAALLTPARQRFARGDLAEALARQSEPFQTFGRWRDVARALAPGGQG